MFTVEKMYGVIESPGANIRPSNALINDLLNLPPGEKVGLQTIEPTVRKAGLMLGGIHFEFHNIGNYWEEVLEACTTSNLEVSYLDDIELHKKANMEILIANRAQKGLAAHWSQQLSTGKLKPEVDSRDKAYQQAIYEATIKSKHAYMIERQNEMVRRIVQNEPRLVVALQVFTDYFASDPVALGDKGVKVGQYRREEVLANLLDPTESVRAGLSRSIPPVGLLSIIMPVRLVERQFNAVTLGRILPEGNPDFIGTWSTVCPSEGLFEVYVKRVKDGEAFGEIYDGLGKAKFHGRIDDNFQRGRVKFYKEYDKDQSLVSVVKERMIYQGNFKDGICRGGYFVEGGRFKGRFTMNPGSKLVM